MCFIEEESWNKLQRWVSPTGWFLAECVFDYRKDHKAPPLPDSAEDRLILLKGKTLKQAVKELKRLVKLGESIPLVCGYEHFVGARNIVPIYDPLESGCELLNKNGKQFLGLRQKRILISRRRIMGTSRSENKERRAAKK